MIFFWDEMLSLRSRFVSRQVGAYPDGTLIFCRAFLQHLVRRYPFIAEFPRAERNPYLRKFGRPMEPKKIGSDCQIHVAGTVRIPNARLKFSEFDARNCALPITYS